MALKAPRIVSENVDHLLTAGHRDLTVLDLSTVALDTARTPLGDPSPVTWLETDLLTWQPPRHWDVWHDRAVLHFLVDDESRAAYTDNLRRALSPGGTFVIGAFAGDMDHVVAEPFGYGFGTMTILSRGTILTEGRSTNHGAGPTFVGVSEGLRSRGRDRGRAAAPG